MILIPFSVDIPLMKFIIIVKNNSWNEKGGFSR